MAALVGFILQDFGLVTGDTVSEFEKRTGELYPQSASAVWGVRICVAIIPIVAVLISLYLLKKFQMTKDDHTMLRAALATKHKYGSVALTDEQIERLELISGQKFENTWLGKDNDALEKHTLDMNEDGKYIVLVEAEEAKKAMEADQKLAKAKSVKSNKT